MNDCTLWTGGFHHSGYGYCYVDGKQVAAHRYAWEKFNGRAIPKGLRICHSCDNKACVNPLHLFLGTDADNVHDMIRKGRNSWRAFPGNLNGRAKLTEKNIRAILQDKRPSKEIAQQYCVAPITVQFIKQRRRWRHLAE